MKRNKTLSYKLSLIFISGMSFALIASGITTYIVTNSIVKNFTNSRLKNSVSEFSKQTDSDLIRAETIVKSVKVLVESKFTEKDKLSDSTFVNNALSEITNSTGLHELPHNEYEDVCAHYVFLNPEYTGCTVESEHGDGFFHVKNENGEFENHDVTNVLKYSEDDVNYAGWWYKVKKSGQPEWLEPYFNDNIDRNMFSYVCPFFSQNNEFLGIVGLDIDLNLVIKDINNTLGYTNAYSYLSTKNGNIIYHKDVDTFIDGKYVPSDKKLSDLAEYEHFEDSEGGIITYKYKGERRSTMSISLSNGLIYGISVKTSELRQPVRVVTFVPLIVHLGLLAIMVFLFYFLIRKYTKPLQELHTAVDMAKKGNYKYKIKVTGNDEISDLTKAYSQMIEAIAEKNRMISAMAYIDGLTGVKNSNAYRDAEKRINDSIKNGTAKFAVAMLDVDKLKMINDNLGHEVGDQTIVGSCYTLCKAFSHSPVFRVGGDEFVAIIEGEDYEKRQEIYAKLKNNEIKVRNTKYEFSVGMATFESGVDHSFKDVFNRADQEMYLSKKAKRKYE